MKRGLLPVAALAVVALTLSACGDDDDNDAPTIPDLSSLTIPDISIPDLTVPDISLPGDLTIPDISIPDISIPDLSIPENAEELLRQIYPDWTDEQVSCVIDVTGGSTPGPEWFDQLTSECDLTLEDLVPG